MSAQADCRFRPNDGETLVGKVAGEIAPRLSTESSSCVQVQVLMTFPYAINSTTQGTRATIDKTTQVDQVLRAITQRRFLRLVALSTPSLVHNCGSLANVDHDFADGSAEPKLVFVGQISWRQAVPAERNNVSLRHARCQNRMRFMCGHCNLPRCLGQHLGVNATVCFWTITKIPSAPDCVRGKVHCSVQHCIK
jgi:hypothetical protein